MTRRHVLCAALLGGCILAAACRRSDVRTAVIDVPGMSDATSVRIVTNAALDEVVGQYDGIQNQYEVDLTRKLVLYHESRRLLSPEYQRRVEARILEVGFSARVLKVQLNPPPVVLTDDGPIQMWPDRFTAMISVPDMTSNTDANIVVDAIAFARIGGDDPRVAANEKARRLVVRYESLHLSLKSLEHAVACAGFEANNTPARLGRDDSIPDGWTHVQL